MNALIAMLAAYLIGSLSCAIIISKFLKLPDPREAGSGNAGATNILRLIGKKQAIIVLLGDTLKGFIAVAIGHLFSVTGFALGLVAVCAVLGHMFPLYFKFKGGKGVATAFGIIIGLSPLLALISVLAWILIAFIFRYASLASISALIICVISSLLLSLQGLSLPLILIAALIIWGHRENIQRLRNNAENKIKLD